MAMSLTTEERAILDGEKGETLQKIMKTLVLYGETFGAERMVPLGAPPHLVTSFGIPLLKPLFCMMDELIAADIKTKESFTADPRPLDYENVKCSALEKLAFRIMYGKQEEYEEQLRKVGLKNKNAFSCACYLDEVGNTPKKGDILSWAESSAVVYANSVIGARSNRNSAIIELFGGIIGRVPEFDLLTDEGRRAKWIVELRTSGLPEAQLLGSAIGLKVMEDVPYIRGLAGMLGGRLDAGAKAYLKDMGAAAASNGAVGLYHIEGLTPEAAELGDALIRPDAKTYIINDDVIADTLRAYPVMWKNKSAKPKLCLIGCPHLSLDQLRHWSERIDDKIEEGKKLRVRTVMTTAPDALEHFRSEPGYRRLIEAGVKLSSICPLMYMNNPICAKKPVITNSNKLRTYTTARYFTDDNILDIIFGGRCDL